MSRPVVTCGVDDSANRAAQLMWEEDIGAVVVLDASKRIAGIVTDRDLCMAAYTRGATLSQILVREVMSKAVAVIGAGERLAAAEALMRSKQVRRLPVVDAGGLLVGVVSLNDIARVATEQRGRKSPAVGVDELVTTLGAICEPRRPQHLARRA
ncbi:MAG: CBS domain-containing protein [Myxococcaceae bacterium]|nr:CBS domain-containing protein [Myxococcaceae bacterium]